MITTITAQLTEWIGDELGKQSFGEDFSWDIGWSAVPTDQGQACYHNVVVCLRHPLIGHNPLTGVFRVVPGARTEEAVREATRRAAASLRAGHRGILQQLKDGKPKPPTRGPTPFS